MPLKTMEPRSTFLITGSEQEEDDHDQADDPGRDRDRGEDA